MWVTRDKAGYLCFFWNNYPERGNCKWSYNTGAPYFETIYYDKLLDKSLFPTLTWEDEPLEVELVPKGAFDAIYEDLQKAENLLRG